MPEFQLSPEQETILDLTEPPNGRGKLVRITAAAGTGKTTTLLHLAQRAAASGHSHITYVTFNRSAAADGQARLAQALREQTTTTTTTTPQQQLARGVTVDARTLHSCAFAALAQERNENFDAEEEPEDYNPRFLTEAALENEIRQELKREIEEFLEPCYRTIRSWPSSDGETESVRMQRIKSAQTSALKQVVFFLVKTLANFCRSKYTLEESLASPAFAPNRDFKRNYFPAKVFHTDRNRGKKMGFLLSHYAGKVGWYADQIHKFWKHLCENQLRTFDVEMKRAQLKHLRIPGTMLLVDECQDMDACQVDWVAYQKTYGTHVFLVGDAAQTIYSFRGAKSSNMMAIEPVINRTLTTSWRFGPEIAQIANIILFAKEKSPQTSSKKPTWVPYRITGGGPDACRVSCDSLVQYCYSKRKQVTLIARANVTLLSEAVKLLGLSVAEDDDEDGNQEDYDFQGHVVTQDSASTSPTSPSQHKEALSSPPLSDDLSVGACSALRPEALQLPRIHINGKGETSGLKKWKSAIGQIEVLYQLFTNREGPMTLPRRQFPEFHGEKVTWESFQAEVENREMTKYIHGLGVVRKFRQRTIEAIRFFQQEVMNKAYSAEEADIILSTCHAAKGLEWDCVQVCEDFTTEIEMINDKGPITAVAVETEDDSRNQRRARSTWQFAAKSYTDDLNLLYVACTRAKRLLSIPSSIKRLLQDCDLLHELVQSWNRNWWQHNGTAQRSSGIAVLGRTAMLSEEETRQLYIDICRPLRRQAGLDENDTLMGSLISDLQEPADDGAAAHNVAIIEETTGTAS